jgi:flavin-dependent dehydrogenase
MDSDVLIVGAGPAGLTLAIERAIRSQGAPVTVRDVPDRIGRDICGYDPILLRPDLHAVWRGHSAPKTPPKSRRLPPVISSRIDRSRSERDQREYGAADRAEHHDQPRRRLPHEE